MSLECFVVQNPRKNDAVVYEKDLVDDLNSLATVHVVAVEVLVAVETAAAIVFEMSGSRKMKLRMSMRT